MGGVLINGVLRESEDGVEGHISKPTKQQRAAFGPRGGRGFGFMERDVGSAA